MTDTGGEAGRRDARTRPRYVLRARGTAWVLARVAAEPFPVETTDIGTGGMMLHASADVLAELAKGDLILLGFPVDGSKDQITVRGRLVWKRQGLMTLLGTWSFGVEFSETPEAEIRRLVELAAAGGAPDEPP